MEYKEAIAKFIDEHGYEGFDNHTIALNILLDYVGNNHYAQKLAQLLLFINSNINIRRAFLDNGLKGGRAIFKEFYYHHKKDFTAEDMVETINPISAIYCKDEYVESKAKIKKPVAVVVRAKKSSNPSRSSPLKPTPKINNVIQLTNLFIEGECGYLSLKQGKEDLPYFVDDDSGKRLIPNKPPHIKNKKLLIKVNRPQSNLSLFLPKRKLISLNINMKVDKILFNDKSLKDNFVNKLVIDTNDSYSYLAITKSVDEVDVRTNSYVYFDGAFKSIKCSAFSIQLFLSVNKFKSIDLNLKARDGIFGLFHEGDCKPKLKKLLFHNKFINQIAYVNSTKINAHLYTYAGSIKIT